MSELGADGGMKSAKQRCSLCRLLGLLDGYQITQDAQSTLRPTKTSKCVQFDALICVINTVITLETVCSAFEGPAAEALLLTYVGMEIVDVSACSEAHSQYPRPRLQ